LLGLDVVATRIWGEDQCTLVKTMMRIGDDDWDGVGVGVWVGYGALNRNWVEKCATALLFVFFIFKHSK